MATAPQLPHLPGFLLGAALFPMRRRDGGMEVERAPEIAEGKRYNGPLAVLVDGDSASAAEMMAGGYAVFKGPLKDNQGNVVIPAGQGFVETAPELESMGYLVEGVVGATTPSTR